MHADDAREIDRQARARNRREREAQEQDGGCLTPFMLGLATWVALFAVAGRFYRGWHG